MAKKKKNSSGKAEKTKQSPAPIPLHPEKLTPEEMIRDAMALFADVLDGADSPVDKAQEIMFDAWDAPTARRAVALAKKALAVSADCADAYNLLAEETAESVEEALELYRKGVAAGERALGKDVFEQDAGHFWGLIETRPYMRSRLGLAQCLWQVGRRDEAIENYKEMLRLNPNDNQGVRDALMACLLQTSRIKEAKALYKKYKRDDMAVWNWTRVLLDFCDNGDSERTRKSLAAAIKNNEFVLDYLTGRKKLPDNLPGYYGFGDDNEAVLYAEENIDSWKAVPGALEWLAAAK